VILPEPASGYAPRRFGRLTNVGFMEFEAGDDHIDGVACSFCGGGIEPGEVDPVELTITGQDDRPRNDGFGVQTNWCHAACLEAAGLSDLHLTQPSYWHDIEPSGD
jgi:hypothetical protein